jgi:hypothetical protein
MVDLTDKDLGAINVALIRHHAFVTEIFSMAGGLGGGVAQELGRALDNVAAAQEKISQAMKWVTDK